MQNIFDAFIQEIIVRAPDLLWAVIIIIFGWIVAVKIKDVVVNFLNKLRLNQMLKALGWESFFDRFDAKLNVPKFFGIIVEVYFFLLFLVMSLDVLSFKTMSGLVGGVIEYYPNIFISIIIFIFTVFIADFSKKIIVGSLDKEKMVYSNFLGDIISSGAWILATLAILYQLQIVQTLILVIFIGVVALIVIVLGISFGLGGKDLAKKMLEDIEKKVR
ncbi:MAG: hypothetical protein WA091_01580 [Minisyncoccales bacterium]